MEAILNSIVMAIAKVHNYIMSLNDAYEYNLSDKQLHFIVVGMIGLFLVLVIHPMFKWIAKHNHVMVISFIYVFTIILTLTFAIEIGQNATGTGVMDFYDIVFGVVGFLFVFAIAMIIRGIWHLICKLVKKIKNRAYDDSEYYEEDEEYEGYEEYDESEDN